MTKLNTYRHLNGQMLKDWYSIQIEDNGETKKVFFLSRIHVNKRVEVTHCYSSKFTDQEILCNRDLVSWVIKRYGADVT